MHCAKKDACLLMSGVGQGHEFAYRGLGFSFGVRVGQYI